MTFLQIIDSAAVETTSTPSPIAQALGEQVVQEKINLLHLLAQGGVMMIPLAILFIAAIWIFIERLLVINQALKFEERLIPTIKDYIVSGNIQNAKTYIKGLNGPVFRVIEKGILRIGKPIDIIESSMENTGKVQMYQLEKRLSILSLIAGIAPIFGFLGTILGMIKLFYGISSTGEYTLNTIAGGIYTKMVTSASGLIIGLLAYVAYSYLNNRIDKVAHKIQETSTELMDILQEPIK